ncbi:TasA family protein [Geodermatophilus sp. SYSU D00815]
MSTKTRRSNTRKVVGSLAIAGTAAAVAGLGTFGTFTDSTTPVATTVQTGTLDINLNQPNGAYSIPVTTSNFVPGDSITRAVTLSNDGSTQLSSVTLTSVATGATSVLTTDTVKGLQLAVKACTVAWTQGGSESAPSYTCSGTERSLYAGPAAGVSTQLSNPASLNPGGVDHLVFSISLPTAADNTFQGKSASLSLTFTGTQRAAAAK